MVYSSNVQLLHLILHNLLTVCHHMGKFILCFVSKLLYFGFFYILYYIFEYDFNFRCLNTLKKETCKCLQND